MNYSKKNNSPIDNSTSWIVAKFGGTSVASAAGWRTIARRCQRAVAAGDRLWLVCSALSGVSTTLDRLTRGELPSPNLQPADVLSQVWKQHIALAQELGVDPPSTLRASFDRLCELVERHRAGADSDLIYPELMASGELMSTHLGVAYLQKLGLGVDWVDAKEHLTADPLPEGHARALARKSATISELDRGSLRDVAARKASIVVTQGFTAKTATGEIVLLGRGGSDTSASYFGVLLDAKTVEIWTDVAGVYSANPALCRNARVLHQLSYPATETLCSLGAKVLHPRCIAPARDHGISITVRSTFDVEADGTVVSSHAIASGIQAVTSRKGLRLLRISRPFEWQPVGLVATIGEIFARYGWSIDLLSTAPCSIAVTLDPAAAPSEDLSELLRELDELGTVTLHDNLESISVVGEMLHQSPLLGEVCQQLSEAEPQMLVVGACGRHVTAVVEAGRSNALLQELHNLAVPESTDPTTEPPQIPRVRRSETEVFA